jgi:hypothetical protein
MEYLTWVTPGPHSASLLELEIGAEPVEAVPHGLVRDVNSHFAHPLETATRAESHRADAGS